MKRDIKFYKGFGNVHLKEIKYNENKGTVDMIFNLWDKQERMSFTPEFLADMGIINLEPLKKFVSLCKNK